MSDSPPKSADVEPEAQSPDDRENNHMDPEHQGTEAQALGYEFDVKEQDRWLPIANGASLSLRKPPPPSFVLFSLTCIWRMAVTGIASAPLLPHSSKHHSLLAQPRSTLHFSSSGGISSGQL